MQLSSRVAAYRPHAALGAAVVVSLLLALSARGARAKETFSIDYIVTISEKHPGFADIRWDLSGIEEVKHLRLRFPADRLDHFRGTGTLEPIPGGLRWIPGGPYAHLTYLANINHVRGQHQRFDSYAGPDWIVTRA